MSTVLPHTWCGLSANLGYMSETCCTRLAANAGRKIIAKNSPSAHHRTNLSSHTFGTKACIDNPKKFVKPQYLVLTCPQYGELRPINGWHWLASLRHRSKFQRVSRLRFVTAATSLTGGQRNLARCLTVSWAGRHGIYTSSGALAPWRNFATCKIHFASKSCVLLYCRYCTASVKICGMLQGMVLRNFRRVRHLYSARRPSRWGSTHILVIGSKILYCIYFGPRGHVFRL